MSVKRRAKKPAAEVFGSDQPANATVTKPAFAPEDADAIQTALTARPLFFGARWSTLWIAVNQVSKIVRGLVVPKLLDPSTYALWASLSVLLGYSQYADLGVNQQLAKRLPFRLARGGGASFRELARQGTGWGLVTSSVVAVGILAWSFLYSGPHPEFYPVALRLVAFAVIAQKLRFMGSTLLSSRFMFRQSAIGGVLVDAIGLGLAVIFLVRWGVLGLVWAFLATELVVAVYYFSQIGFPRPSFAPSRTLPLVREGLLLLGVVLIEQALMTVDQIFLIFFFPKTEYGIYALGLFLTTALLSASGIFLNVTQPKVMYLAGEGKLTEARAVVRTSLMLYIVLLSAGIGIAVLATDLMVTYYLSNYQAGLKVFVLMPILALVRCPVILLRPLFLARNHEKRLIVITGSGLVLSVVLDVLIVSFHPSLTLVAVASIMGYAPVALTLAYNVLSSSERSERQENRFILALALSSIVGSIGLFLFYDSRNPAEVSAQGYLAESMLACAAYTIGAGLIVWVGRPHWMRAWKLFRYGSEEGVRPSQTEEGENG